MKYHLKVLLEIHFCVLLGNEDMMMTDMNEYPPVADGDEVSITSTDTYSSTGSIWGRDLRESLPSHLFKEIRALPSAKGARKSIRNTGSARNRRQGGSAKSSTDETDFVHMSAEDTLNQKSEIRHMATSLEKKKNVLYVKINVERYFIVSDSLLCMQRGCQTMNYFLILNNCFITETKCKTL